MGDVELDNFGRRKKEPSERRERSPPVRNFRDRRPRDDREERRRTDSFFEIDRRHKDKDMKRRKSMSPRDRIARSPPMKRPAYESRDRGRVQAMVEGPEGIRRAPGLDHGQDFRRDEVMLSYKQFIQELDDDVSPAEAEKRYEAYKVEFENSRKLSFFNQHKDDDWLRDRYDPVRLEDFLKRRNENAQGNAKDFFEVLLKEKVNIAISATIRRESKDGNEADRRQLEEDENREKEDAKKVPASAESAERIFIDTHQAFQLIKKLDKEKAVAENVLTVKELSAGKKESGEDEYSLPLNGEGEETFTLGGIKLLDTLLTYLWKVHGVDYYGGTELRGFPRGLRTIRGQEKAEKGEYDEKKDGWSDVVDKAWKTRLSEESSDPIIGLLGKDKEETLMSEALDELVRKIKDEKYGWKYGCSAEGCAKLFHGPEFVLKHMKLKHANLVDAKTKRVKEELFKQNFLSDPDAPVPAATVSKNPPVNKLDRPGFRPQSFERNAGGFQGRFGGRDTERGGREFVRHSRGNFPESFDPRHPEPDLERDYFERERFSRGDREFERERGPRDRFDPFESGFSGGRGARLPFDDGVFGGSHAIDAPLPFGGAYDREYGLDSEYPAVLVPLPGAGPLGPFVAASPELTMRVLREGNYSAISDGFDLDAPPPFEKGLDGDRSLDVPTRLSGGRGGRSGGRGILPPPLGLKPDPRSVRSYRDLDAPEDEVTVMDYRGV